MNWLLYAWRLINNKKFRNAVKSILWSNVIYPLIVAASKKIFSDMYAIVLRSVQTAEKMANDGSIEKEAKWKKALELIEVDAISKGVEMSAWAKNWLIETAVAELDSKWEEFG